MLGQTDSWGTPATGYYGEHQAIETGRGREDHNPLESFPYLLEGEDRVFVHYLVL